MAIIQDTAAAVASPDLSRLWAAWDVPSSEGKDQNMSERLGNVSLDRWAAPTISLLLLSVSMEG